MTSSTTILPLGLIVEGHGEYESFPSLIYKILKRQPGEVPRVNAWGIGGIVKREKLHENINSIARLKPLKRLIVCIDLEECLKEGICSDCQDLKNILDGHISSWLDGARSDQRIALIPQIVTVIQIKKFENWMISDVASLVSLGMFGEVEQDTDVDNLNPTNYIRLNAVQDFNSKNPKFVKSVISALDPDVMKVHSRSFNKFYREVVSAYS